MRTIIGMFWAVMGGLFIAAGVIVFTQLIGAGSDLLGFSEWTFRYYMLCLGVCIALLIGSKPARKQWAVMMFFFVAVMLVIGVGFHTFSEVASGDDELARMQEHAAGLAILMAKAVMYVAPGAVTAFYACVAYDGVSSATAPKPLS